MPTGWTQNAIDEKLWESAKSEGGGRIISRAITDRIYTAEYNLVPSKTQVAALFAYEEANRFGFAEIEPELNRLSLGRMEDGNRKVLATAELPDDTDWSKLHTIRIERGNERLRVYLDGVLKLDESSEAFGPGHIGYRYDNGVPGLSYTAFSNQADGSSDFETAKPLPGSMEAVHYLSGEGRGMRSVNRRKPPHGVIRTERRSGRRRMGAIRLRLRKKATGCVMQ